MLLSLKEVFRRHTGETLAKYVIAAIVEWDIASKLGYFQMDNAAPNETLMVTISTGNVPWH
jgi:hypothetical protein